MTSRIQHVGDTVRRLGRRLPPPAGALRSSGPGAGAPGDIICHGDFGPWNGVWHAQRVVGLIDFDHARPAPPVFDIAYALE